MSGRLQLEALPGERFGGLSDTLREERLPTVDEIDDADRLFFCASVEGVVVGYVGLEVFGEDAVLRSAVIFLHARRRGLGREMVDQLLEVARDERVRRVWLLTESAPEFFARAGFAPARRDEVPPAIAQSAEFAKLCPVEAMCMVHDLGARRGGESAT